MTNGNQNEDQTPEQITEDIERRLLILTARTFSMSGADQDILEELVDLLTNELRNLKAVIAEGSLTPEEVIRRLNAILLQTILVEQIYE